MVTANWGVFKGTTGDYSWIVPGGDGTFRGHTNPNYRRKGYDKSLKYQCKTLKAMQLQKVHKLPMMTMTHHGQIKFFIHLNKWSEESMVRRECHKIIIIRIQTRNLWHVWKNISCEKKSTASFYFYLGCTRLMNMCCTVAVLKQDSWPTV